MRWDLKAADITANPDQALLTFEEISPYLSKLEQPPTQELIDALLKVLGNSNFLARWARKWPEKASRELGPGLDLTWGKNEFHQELFQSTDFKDIDTPESLSSILLDFKYRHLFRNCLRDLGLGKPFSDLAAELSHLALSISHTSLNFFQDKLENELGIPRGEKDNKDTIPFTILSLGKLGGMELNFSSDIDILYIYGEDKGGVFRENQPTQVNLHHYFTKLSETLTNFLNKKTSDGFLYRVDLELRPEGSSGSITNSIEALESYYETFGAPWEKQAMIKANLCSGSETLFQNFLDMIHPFVYPKISDYSFLVGLKEMKEKILKSIKGSSQRGYHVKLGEGGIREIEFFVQSFQILFGGRMKGLQTSNTLQAIQAIHQAGLIKDDERDRLTNAYIFLRTLENRLQQVEEQQTHRLPENEDELFQLACRMNYLPSDPADPVGALKQDLEKHRAFVQEMFDRLLSGEFRA